MENVLKQLLTVRSINLQDFVKYVIQGFWLLFLVIVLTIIHDLDVKMAFCFMATHHNRKSPLQSARLDADKDLFFFSPLHAQHAQQCVFVFVSMFRRYLIDIIFRFVNSGRRCFFF